MPINDNIEKIFKDRFESFEQTPPSSVWTKIEKKMFFKHFLKYKPFSVNLWNILAVTAISISALVFFTDITDNAGYKITEENQHKTGNNNTHEKSVIAKANKNKEQILDTKPDTEKNKKENLKIIINKSENQISDKKETEVIPGNLQKENYANSKSTIGGKITVKLAEPRSEFSVSTTSACEPAVISFLNKSENCDSYRWDFGNGKTSFEKNPTFVFRTAGTFKVTLTVTSGRFSDSETKTITVYPKPNTDFQIKNKDLYQNEEIHFSNTSSGYSKCIWNFGDNNTSTYTNPSHIYTAEGNYKVSLLCISDKKCADTAFLNKVFIQDDKYKIYFPSAFSPDKNGQNNGYWRNSVYPNSIFHPVINTEISDYRLRIYNKYGNLVFESNNPEIGWNGFYKNLPSPTGVYVWECSGKFENGKLFKKTGNLTLLYLRNQ